MNHTKTRFYLCLASMLCHWALLSLQAQSKLASVHVAFDHSRVLPHSTKFDLAGNIKDGKSVLLGAQFMPKSRIYAQKNRILTGVNLFYFDSGNRVMGDGWGFFGSLQGKFFQVKRLEAHFQFGMGGIWMAAVNDSLENPNNLVNASHVNGYFSARMRARYPLLKGLSATATGGLTHYSNGAFRLPNLGVNSLVLGLGIEYSINRQDDQPFYPAVGALPTLDSVGNWFGSIRVGAGQFQNRKTGDATYWAWNVSAFGHWELRRQFALSPGLVYERTNYLEGLRANFPEGVQSQNFRVSVECTMDWFFNHVYMRGGLGYYLFKPDRQVSDNKMYYRLSANYCFKNTRVSRNRTPFVGIGLKSYKNIAQYPELIMGYLL